MLRLQDGHPANNLSRGAENSQGLGVDISNYTGLPSEMLFNGKHFLSGSELGLL